MFNKPNKFRSLTPSIQLVAAATISPVPIKWCWKGHLACGKFHILAGAPGTGKTNLAINQAATISNGGFWPDGTAAPFGKVIIWTGEDGVADTIVVRLIAAGANLQNILVLQGTVEHGRERAFDFTTDIELLKTKVEELGDVKLVVIDSIAQVVKGDAHKNSDVRQALAPLLELGEKNGCAILGITHLNKNSKGKNPLDRVNGSIAYTAAARIVMLTARMKKDDPDASPTCVLVRAKSNIGPDDGGFEYEIRNASFYKNGHLFDTATVSFNSDPLNGSAKDILQFAESGGVTESSSAVAAAALFLTDLLAHGPKSAQEVELKAQEAGIAMSAVKRAKLKMGVVSQRQNSGPSSVFCWSLNPTPSQPLRQPNSYYTFEDVRNESVSSFVRKHPQAQPSDHGAFVAPVAPVAPVEHSEARANSELADRMQEYAWRVMNRSAARKETDVDNAMLDWLITKCKESLATRLSTVTDADDLPLNINQNIVEQVLDSIDLIHEDVRDKYVHALGHTRWWIC